MKYLLERLSERTTWLGLVMLISSLGWWHTEIPTEEAVDIATGLFGLIFTLTKDKA